MKRSYPNLNHPLLYEQGVAPPQGTRSLTLLPPIFDLELHNPNSGSLDNSSHTSITFFRSSHRTLPSAFLRRDILSLILIVCYLTRLKKMVNIQEDNERTGESSPDPNTPLKEMNPSIQNAQQLETALKELLKRKTREAEIASDTMKKADEGDGTGDSRSRTWKPSTVIGKPPAKENSKHPFSLEILSEELPKKFKYPVDIELYDGTSGPKHHLDVFDNRMVLLNASNAVKCKAVTVTLKKDALT
ncbi:hypothetical protein PIB30_006267 [Stylosanthes scabra]|uniref:Uncharacterized protein n=1 Tax=Stylosanthes scabra TaxID=79078 RepID=A0ABU6Q491_9FABA|nr:hypothetical protein [Stylosanthes scabra]